MVGKDAKKKKCKKSGLLSNRVGWGGARVVKNQNAFFGSKKGQKWPKMA